MNKKLKITLRFLLLLLALLLVGMAGLLWWLTSSPRSLPVVSYYIERNFQELDSNLKVTIESSVVKWSGFRTPLTLTVSNVKINESARKIEMAVPEMRIGIDPLMAIRGHLRFSHITVQNPLITLSVGGFTEDMEKDSKDNLALGKLLEGFKERLIAGGYEGLPIKKITIISARVMDGDSQKMLLNIDNSNIGFLRHGENIELDFRIQGRITEQQEAFNIAAVTRFINNNQISLAGEFKGVNIANLDNVFPDRYGLSGINLVLDGGFSLIFNENLAVESAEISINSGEGGQISYEKLFPTSIPVSELHLRFKATNDFSEIAVSNFYLRAGDDAKITAGDFLINYPNMEKAAIKGRVDMENIDIPTLLELWPEDENSANAKAWVRDSLSVGRAVKGYAYVDIKPGDLIPKALPEEDLKAEIEVEGIEVNYNPKLSHLTEVAGTLKFGGNTLNIEARSGKFRDSEIKNSSALISDLSADASPIHIEGEAAGKAEDFNEFIALQAESGQKKDRVLKITGGTAATKFTLDFPLLNDLLVKDIKVTAHAKTEGLTIPAIYEGVNLTEGNFAVDYSSEELKAAGDARLNGVQATAKYSEKYNGDKTENTIEVVGQFPKAEISRFIGNDLEFLEGEVPLGVNVAWETAQHIDVKADLKDNAISLPEYGYEKEKGMPLNLVFVLDGDKKESHGNFSLTGDLRGEGNITFAENYKLVAADIKNLAFGKNNLDVKYRVQGEKQQVDITGKTLDVAALIDDRDKADAKKSERPYDISVNVEKAVMKDAEEINNLQGNLSCLPDYCTTGRFAGKQAGNGEFLYELKETGESYRMAVHADDAGSLIKGLGISPNIVGGKLDINSEIKHDKNNSINEGNLLMINYSVTKAPVLAKIVSLASFTGILDLLNGEGISFKKLSVNFTKDNDVLKIDGGKTYGSALGLTADGFIDLKKSDISIKGSIVPSYTLNSLLGNVPLIGDALIGGEGKGILAANYEVSGDYKNPNVSVNPLTLLAPGFLRGLFDIFEEKKTVPQAEDKNIKPEVVIPQGETPNSPVNTEASPVAE